MAVLVLALTATVLPAHHLAASAQEVGAAVPADSEVQRAQAALEDARQRMAATTARLDQLAETFETSRSHAERLAEELQSGGGRIEQAEASIAEARSAALQEVRAAYMQPGVDLVRISGAFLLAPDVGTALHASAMMQRVASNRAHVAASAERLGVQIAAEVSTQRTVASGATAALQDVASLAQTFTAALDGAIAEVAVAEEQLAGAEAAAAQRAAAAAAAQVAVGSTVGVAGTIGNVPAPAIRIATINGGTQEMTCPLGQPNGFIDSWGFPRSGGRTHKGADMFAAYGMPIFAAADGHIRRVFNNRLGGLSIDLVDTLGNRYYYAHLSATYVTSGQSVQVGQLVAANGNSGNAIATPPHLHWQFHPADGGPVNPFPLAAALCR